jgi:hypothetical protein
MQTACVIRRARNLYQYAGYLRDNEDDEVDTRGSEPNAPRISVCDFALPFPDKACSAQHSGFCPDSSVTQDRAFPVSDARHLLNTNPMVMIKA